MTTYVVVAVMDLKVQAFGRPMFVPSVGAAVRSFGDEVNRNAPDNVMFSHPEDFVMYHLGAFEDATGKFSMLEVPAIVAQGSSVKT